MIAIDRLLKHLKVCSTRYPAAWRKFDELRSRRKELGDWPAWCFCPVAASYAIVCQQHGVEHIGQIDQSLATIVNGQEPAESPALDVSRLAGLGAWRNSQDVYAIDATVLEAVLETPINNAIPVEVLLTLPQWSIYVPTPGREISGNRIDGFFAFLEHDANHHRTELRFLFDFTDADPFNSLNLEVLFLSPGDTLEESYQRSLDEAKKQAARSGLMSSEIMAAHQILLDQGGERLAPYLSVLLYLCSQTAEYRASGATANNTKPGRPAAKKTKEGWRFFPPDRPHIWHIGERLGSAIREAIASERDHDKTTRSGPRPHVRRAHWHGFWSGPKTGTRKFQLRWLPPIAVALVDDSPEARMRHAKLKPIRDLDAEISQIRNELEPRHAGASDD